MEKQAKAKKATIYDVATFANVSIATVSRVLNGIFRGESSVKQRVESAIRQLNYEPSTFARGMSGKPSKTNIIGVLAPFFTDPFFVEVLRGVYRTLHVHSYHIVLHDVDSREMKKNLLGKLVHDEMLDGLLVVNMHMNHQEYSAIAARMPVMFVAAVPSFAPYVAVDHYKGIEIGLEFVYEMGHTSLAFINNTKRIHEAITRERAFLDTAKRLGIQVKIDSCATDHQEGYRAAARLIEEDPDITCLFYYSDLMAYGGFDYVRDHGIEDRVSVIGIDGFDRTFQMGLTSVVQPMVQMGQIGAQRLIEEIEESSGSHEGQVLTPWLFAGGSCKKRSV